MVCIQPIAIAMTLDGLRKYSQLFRLGWLWEENNSVFHIIYQYTRILVTFLDQLHEDIARNADFADLFHPGLTLLLFL